MLNLNTRMHIYILMLIIYTLLYICIQFADADTQNLRAKQINTAMQESQMKQSVLDIVEARCHNTMGQSDSVSTYPLYYMYTYICLYKY